MIAQYYLEIRTAAGTRVDLFDDYKELEFTRVLNDIGIGRVVLHGDHRAISKLEQDGIITIWRYHPNVSGGNAVIVFAGLFQGIISKLDRRANSDVEIIFPDANILMQRAVNAFQADVSNRTSFNTTFATIVGNLLTYNVLTGEPGVRLIDPVSNNGVSRLVVLGLSGGATIQYTGEYKNILTEIQALCAKLDIYWTVQLNVTNSFHVTFGVGTYKVDSVLFDVQRANISSSEIDARNVDEITKVLVLGQGSSNNKTTSVRTSSRYTKFNHVEAIVNADELGSSGELQDAGDSKLESTRYFPNVQFEAVQTPGCLWQVDYDLGDIVSSRIDSVNVFQRIYQVSVSINSEGERISLLTKSIRQPQVSETITISEARTITIV